MFIVFIELTNDNSDIERLIHYITDSLENARSAFNGLKLKDYMVSKSIFEYEKDVNDVDEKEVVTETHEEFSVFCNDRRVCVSKNINEALEVFNSVQLPKYNLKKLVSSTRGVLKTSSFLIY
jgi:hypothetical protein